jgi:hypothetical protein
MSKFAELQAKLKAQREAREQAAAQAKQAEQAELSARADAAVEKALVTVEETRNADPHFVVNRVAQLPTNWWGSQRDAVVEAIGAEAVDQFQNALNTLMTSDKGDIKMASLRLQDLMRDKLALSTLLNPAIMKAIVEKLSSARGQALVEQKTRASTAANNKAGKAQAREALDELLGDM